MTAATSYDMVQAVLAEARWWLARSVREDPPGSNRGVFVDFANYYALPDWHPYPEGMKGAPWCASSVHLIGRLAVGTLWPVPRTPGCQAIANWAKARGVLHHDAPEPGELFLLYYPNLKRYGHTGFVLSVEGGMIGTAEGNTGAAGEREGWGMFARRRMVTDRTAFVRWWGVA